MAAPFTTASASELLVPGLGKIFFDSYRAREEQWSKFLNRRSSKRNFEEDLEMAAFGTAPVKTEGDAIQFQVPVQGTKRRYTHVTYGLGYRVTEEMMEDDLYGPARRASTALGRSLTNVTEQTAANVLTLGFTTELGFKSEALFTASHTLIRGGTSSNRAAVDEDLSVTALENALIIMRQQVTEEGFPFVSIPKLLVVGTDLDFVADEIVSSPDRPDTANRAINTLNRRGMTYIVSDYLTDPDSWFIMADEHDLNMFIRRDASFQGGDDFDSGDAKFKATKRFSVGHGDWRGTFGSLGA